MMVTMVTVKRHFLINTNNIRIRGDALIGLLTKIHHDYPQHIFKHMVYGATEREINKLSSLSQSIVQTTREFLKNLQLEIDTLNVYENTLVGTYRSVRYSETESIRKTNYGLTLYTPNTAMISEFRNQLKYYTSYYDTNTRYRHNFQAEQLEKLQRCRMNINQNTGVKGGSTFSKPLNMHIGYVNQLQNDIFTKNYTKVIVSAVNIIINFIGQSSLYVIVDDIIRKYLSEIDDLTFGYSYESQAISQIVTNFHGLSTVGGPRGWVDSDIIELIDDWISKDHCKGDDIGRCFADNFFTNKINEWSKTRKTQSKLTFKEFCSDPMRWATSGGAPKVKVGDEEIRSKWAWALSTLQKTSDVPLAASELTNLARVALKEEKKTRTVITTPLLSYLRQCYILYVLGHPPLNSTVADRSLVEYLARSNCKYYMSVDASKFDHNITKKQVLRFFELIRDTCPELEDIVNDEIDHIQHLRVTWNDKDWDYNNGLLSGWRITSIFGSMYTCGLAEYVKEKTGIPFNYITQGDDIIFFTNYKIDSHQVIKCCESYGIDTNEEKTHFGEFGEFLKYRYSQDYICGYSARNVRSLYLANPWLDTSIDVDPQALAGRWASYFSRLMMSCNKTFSQQHEKSRINVIIKDIFSWLRGNIPLHVIRESMKTPTSLGGLAPVEMIDLESTLKCTSITTIREEKVPGDIKFMNLFVGLKSSRVRTEKKTITSKHLVDFALSYRKMMNGVFGNTDYVQLKHNDDANIFRSIIETVLRGRHVPVMNKVASHLTGNYTLLDSYYPRYLKKTSNWYERLKMLMQGDDIGAPLSMFGSLRYNGMVSNRIHRYTRIYMNGLRTVTANSANIMGGFAFTVLKNTISLLNTP